MKRCCWIFGLVILCRAVSSGPCFAEPSKVEGGRAQRAALSSGLKVERQNFENQCRDEQNQLVLRHRAERESFKRSKSDKSARASFYQRQRQEMKELVTNQKTRRTELGRQQSQKWQDMLRELKEVK